ncbi:unnamed protein product, partial [Ascophyllum nodosum]
QTPSGHEDHISRLSVARGTSSPTSRSTLDERLSRSQQKLMELHSCSRRCSTFE